MVLLQHRTHQSDTRKSPWGNKREEGNGAGCLLAQLLSYQSAPSRVKKSNNIEKDHNKKKLNYTKVKILPLEDFINPKLDFASV